MFTLCFVAFFLFVLSFVWVSFSHSSCTLHASSLPLFISSFLSLIPLDSFVYSWQKGGEYIGEYSSVFRHFYMTLVYILRGRNSTSCTFVGEKSHREDTYTKGEKIFFMSKPCFVLFYIMLVFSLLYGTLYYILYLCFVALDGF